MSALGHYLEEEGIGSVAIALIRPQAEKTRPPRALWVPFELGRPIGPPGDPVFQKRVILTALQMLVGTGGPVRIADFPDDDPREATDPVQMVDGAKEVAGKLRADHVDAVLLTSV